MQVRFENDPHPVVSIVVVGVLAVAAVAFPWACGSGAQLTPLNQCRLESVSILPKDPNMATVYDAVDVIERLLACERMVPDGGVHGR
jgi:hypothetical protein